MREQEWTKTVDMQILVAGAFVIVLNAKTIVLKQKIDWKLQAAKCRTCFVLLIF